MVGNNTPVFFIRDPLKFPDFIHTQKRDPATNAKDPDMFWDFLSLTPESIHQVTILFSDRGTPKSYRHMNGYSSHTFKWYNEKGEYFWVKIHFKTEQGIQNLTRQEAERMDGEDPDHATRDLFQAIERGEYPAWKVCVQIMTPEQAENYRLDSFDITKVWPHGDSPLDRDRPHGAQPQPGELLRRGGAGRVLPRESGARHRRLARQDAPGAHLQLS